MSLIPNPNLTDHGNPAKPEGEAGEKMLEYMNEEHADLTAWALAEWTYRGDETLLDVGCGGGATLKRLSELISKGHLYGVDYSEISVELSRKTNAKEIAEGKTEIRFGSVSELPFMDDFFDKIITVESFYFWPSPKDSLAEVRRVLKPGGSFLLVSEIYERPDLTAHIRDNIQKYQMYVPGIEELRGLFREAGYSRTLIHRKEGEFWIAVEGLR